jgi:hypothetical protein
VRPPVPVTPPLAVPPVPTEPPEPASVPLDELPEHPNVASKVPETSKAKRVFMVAPQ